MKQERIATKAMERREGEEEKKNGRRAGIGLHAVTVPSGRQKGATLDSMYQPFTASHPMTREWGSFDPRISGVLVSPS